MSEKDEEAVSEEAGTKLPADDATFDPIDTDDPADPQAEDPGKGPKRGALASVAWLALFLSLIGVAGVGYVLLDDSGENRILNDARTAVDNLRADIDTSDSAIDALRTELADVRSEFGSAGNDTARLSSRLDRLEAELERRQDLVNSLPPRMSQLEQAVAGLQGVSVEARNTYLVAEAEYYMQIANAQLQLAGNPYLASLALRQADDRLLQLADPALTDVRRALSNEIASLDAMERPDIAGATLTLGSLSRVVESLPMRPFAGEEAESEAPETGEEEGGMTRAWNSVKGAFSGLVDVTAPTDDRAPFLKPGAEPMVRGNLSLMLQAARLALLRGEQAAFEQSLDDADAWLATYFNTESAPVAGARETIAEIRVDYSSTTAPDISGSLRLLRQYRTLAESGP